MIIRAVVALCLGLVSVAPAAAQSPRSEQDDRAANHFRAGSSYFSEERFEEALDEFEEAYRLSGRAQMLYNIGLSFERLGRWDEAADAYARFIDRAPDDPNIETARERMERARGRAVANTPTDPERGTDEADGGSSVAPWIILGASALVGVGALVTGLVAHGIAEDLASACMDGVCPADREDDANLGQGLAVASTVMTFVAAAGGITAVVLLLVGGNADEDEAQARVQATPLPGGGHLSFGASF